MTKPKKLAPTIFNRSLRSTRCCGTMSEPAQKRMAAPQMRKATSCGPVMPPWVSTSLENVAINPNSTMASNIAPCAFKSL